MLVDLCERIWLVVMVRVDYVIADDDTREALGSIVLGACDGIRVCDLVDICDAKWRGPIGRFTRHHHRRRADSLWVENGSDFVITIGVFILNDNHLPE